MNSPGPLPRRSQSPLPQMAGLSRRCPCREPELGPWQGPGPADSLGGLLSQLLFQLPRFRSHRKQSPSDCRRILSGRPLGTTLWPAPRPPRAWGFLQSGDPWAPGRGRLHRCGPPRVVQTGPAAWAEGGLPPVWPQVPVAKSKKLQAPKPGPRVILTPRRPSETRAPVSTPPQTLGSRRPPGGRGGAVS